MNTTDEALSFDDRDLSSIKSQSQTMLKVHSSLLEFDLSNTSNEALSYAASSSSVTQSQTSQKEKHEATCNKCQAYPIKGIRYKCSVCQNYNLCRSCNKKNKNEHEHPLLQLLRPDQAPSDGHLEMV